MATAIEQKPCAAEALVGTEQEILHGRGKKRRTVKGIIIDWRHGTATIEKLSAPEDGSRPLAYPTFDLKIKPHDGGNAVWVRSFKDGNNGYPSDLWLGWEETMNQRDAAELMRSIRRTIRGHCAGEQVTYAYNDDAWNAAAFDAIEDVCQLMAEHFPDAEQDDIGLILRY